ncbi:immunoglobulin superfamily member 3-like [Stegastes partitus]|uniref:Immunoglobulin superfamily member 3-like n=1 Tax=Stegastes partitus TaxID=144197 RepID=A0A3B4ZLF7_9TELE|nr:PREDICTED: immunoglobulin superfamily member 3-like [Stegastes partitus]
MRYSLHSLWRANLLLCLALLVHHGEAAVLTEAQAGPLYRVVGSELSISCRVSGFIDEAATKHFEYRVFKPAKPNFELNIISTQDPSFGYAVYQERVMQDEIALERTSLNSVKFKIQSLRKDDEGDYECTAVNLESGYYGVYSVKTTVKVIDNSLSVSSPDSTSLSFNEGEALTLTCQAVSTTIQHTHLSFAWYLHKDGESTAQPIISLDKDFTLKPGPGFGERYQAGLISLDKLGETSYRLKMAQLEVSDQGKIYCQAQEWIQDPDRSWYSIAQKEAEKITLKVKAREVVPDTTSLVVKMSAQQTTLQEGQELMLSCSIDTQNLEERFFSVAFLRGTVELARLGPTGVLSVGPEYSSREKEGDLRATRIGNRDYRLILQPVRTTDQGKYVCRAQPQNRGQDGAFTQGASQDSNSQLVSISAPESGLSVKMQGAVNVTEGDMLRLSCKVDGVKGQLSVTWQRKSSSTPSAPFTSLISLSQEGVVEKAEEFMSRKVRSLRPATDNFILELDKVTPSDSGVYQCAVSEWKANSKIYSQSQAASVAVTPIESMVKVYLISRSNKATVGENVELMCRVKGPRMPITLAWSLQRDASNVDNIVTLYSDGAISWFGNQDRYQLKVQSNSNEVVHYLQIIGASHREEGSYQCSVSIVYENVLKKLNPSNPLAVKVLNPESKLTLSSSPTLTANINTDTEIKCSVVSNSSSSSHYSVTWLLQQEAENKTIVSSDRNALVTFGPKVELSHRQRISMRRSKGPSFELTIRQARISDKGSYICEVVEWLQDPRGDWYKVSKVSKTTKLTVTEPANDLRLNKTEPPLVYREGDDVELKCNIISGASSASFFYKVTWFYTVHSSSTTNTSLVELDHTGLLSYPENKELRGLQARLCLLRPTKSSFYLTIQRAHEGDSGAYWCQVEQYQLDNEGRWQQKASDSAGPISLNVTVAEKSLSIAKEEVELNLSISEDFTIPCHIDKQSSNESKFQVTWFWQKATETTQRPIFTVYRNSTLQDWFEKDVQLRFSHPVTGRFNLAVLKSGPENSGLYFCEVEEWIPSPPHEWRKFAVERSGNMTVSVITEGNVQALSGCNSSTWIGITVVIVIVSLLVIIFLVLMIRKSKVSGGKKAKESLWAEQSLTAKPSVED